VRPFYTFQNFRKTKPAPPRAVAFLLLALLLFPVLVVGCRPPAAALPSIPGELATLLPPVLAPDEATALVDSESADPIQGEEKDESSQSTEIAEPTEHPVTLLPLASVLENPELEFSGMAWYGDRLFLLPQYPSRFGGQAFSIDRRDILAYLNGESEEAIAPSTVHFDDGGLSRMIAGFEGYEAIAFDGDTAYLTIETNPGGWMLGYVVTGTMAIDGSALKLAPDQLVPVQVQANLSNMTDETLVVDGDRVLTIYEANGAGVNIDPIVNVHSLTLEKLEPLPLPHVEYRITDATDVDDAGRFWAINYFFPNDKMLQPYSDPLVEQYGAGATHQTKNHVERLLEFQIDAAAVRLANTPPIQLELAPLGLPRNWEGIVRLEDGDVDGFLLVTDKFPTTRIGFVERQVR
jgi:hypothetical protein